MTDALAVKKTDLKSIMRSQGIISRFEEVAGKANAGAYISDVLIAVSQNDQLKQCEPNSIIAAALRAASMRLSCDPITGQAYLVPFRSKRGLICTLIVGYKGLYQLALRTGKYRYLNLITVYSDDELYENRMTGVIECRLSKSENIYVPLTDEYKRQAKIMGYMLYFKLNSGLEKSFYMTVEQCAEHGAKYSKSYSDPRSLWQTDPHKMYQKTVIRLGLMKWGYLDPHDLMAMSNDDEDEEVEEPENFVDGLVVDEEKRTVNQSLNDLGFPSQDPLPEEKDQPEPDEPSEYEIARNVTDAFGKKFGSMTDSELKIQKENIEKELRASKLDTKTQSLYLARLDAIRVILDQNSGQPDFDF